MFPPQRNNKLGGLDFFIESRSYRKLLELELYVNSQTVTLIARSRCRKLFYFHGE